MGTLDSDLFIYSDLLKGQMIIGQKIIFDFVEEGGAQYEGNHERH